MLHWLDDNLVVGLLYSPRGGFSIRNGVESKGIGQPLFMSWYYGRDWSLHLITDLQLFLSATTYSQSQILFADNYC